MHRKWSNSDINCKKHSGRLNLPGNFLQIYHGRFVAHCRDDLLHQIRGSNPQAGGVDTRVATHILTFQHILIDQQTDTMVMIIHQAQNAQ